MGMTALEARDRLSSLRAERSLVAGTVLGTNAAYMADLEDELSATTAIYVGASVTEIATLRGALWGPQQG